MKTLDIVLLVLAAVCFVAAAVGAPASRVNLVAAGLLFWVLVPLVAALQAT